MGLRFRKSFKIAPGVRVSVGKKSVGMSVGGKLGGISVNSKSGTRARVSAPGTGLSYSTKVGGDSSFGKEKPSGSKSSTGKKPGCLIAVAALLGLLLIGSCGGSDDTQTPEPTEAPIVTEAPTATQKPTSTPEPTESADPTATPEPTNTPKPTSKPTSKPATYFGVSGSRKVYISSSGKIHLKSDCSGMKSYKEMTMEKAVNSGYSTCGRCFD